MVQREDMPRACVVYSNVAVDNMVAGLLDMGVNVVRVGEPAKVKASLRGATLDARLALHPAMAQVEALRAKSIALHSAARQEVNEGQRRVKAREGTALWTQAEGMKEEAAVEILRGADVVAATCVSSLDESLLLLHSHFEGLCGACGTSCGPAAAAPSLLPAKDTKAFSICVIDEAAQATLPVSLIALLVAGAHCAVLAGDPQQLPPTVISQKAHQLGLGRSLYVRLQDAGLAPMLLDTQYRSGRLSIALLSLMNPGMQ